MRCLGSYVAALLAADAISTSSSLGMPGERLSQREQSAAQLTAQLDTVQRHVRARQWQNISAAQPDGFCGSPGHAR